MGPRNGGRYRQVIAIRRWSIAQVLLYILIVQLQDQVVIKVIPDRPERPTHHHLQVPCLFRRKAWSSFADHWTSGRWQSPSPMYGRWCFDRREIQKWGGHLRPRFLVWNVFERKCVENVILIFAVWSKHSNVQEVWKRWIERMRKMCLSLTTVEKKICLRMKQCPKELNLPKRRKKCSKS